MSDSLPNTINNTSSPTSTPLVSIPNCTAHHLLGTEQIHLASNAILSLIPVKGSSSTPPLTLTIGETLAFPLDSQTLLGTQTGNGSVYLLRPHLEGVEGAQGWIKIELPDGVEVQDSALGQLREKWEEVLVQHGFLIGTGARAGGDEITASLREGAADVKASIEAQADRYKATHAPTDAPASFSRTTHSRFERTSDLTGTAASYAQSAVNAIGGLSHSIGASLASAAGVGQVAEGDKSAARKGAEDAGYAVQDASNVVADTAASVSRAAGQAVKDVLEHSEGKETADLAGHAGSAAGSVGAAAGSGLMATSAAFHGGEAVRGIAEVDLAEGEKPHPSTEGKKLEDVVDLQQ